MTTFQRYLLIQVPGWALAVIILSGLYLWAGLPLWIAVALFTGYVGKDFVLYPFLRRAYETSAPMGVEELIGAVAITTEQLDPQGYVHVRGELWRAETAPGTPAIPKGSQVRVQSAHGMTLVVAIESYPEKKNVP